MGITHFDDAPRAEFEIGHLGGRWTFLSQGAGGWQNPSVLRDAATQLFPAAT